MNKTDKVDFNVTMKLANDFINCSFPTNKRKEASNQAFGLLLKICLKTSMRVSDILKLEYSQFKEDKSNFNGGILTYYVKKSSITNTIPIGADLMNEIQRYKAKCMERNSVASEMIFYNYQTKSMFTRVWASNNVSKANKNGKLGQIVNVAGTHSIRKTAVNEIFDKTQDLKMAKKLLGHKNILTTSIYIADSEKTMMDKLKAVLC